MTRENGSVSGLEFDSEAGKYESFPVQCKTCKKEYQYNAPQSKFGTDQQWENFRKEVAADFECQFCKKGDEEMDRVAASMDRTEDNKTS